MNREGKKPAGLVLLLVLGILACSMAVRQRGSTALPAAATLGQTQQASALMEQTVQPAAAVDAQGRITGEAAALLTDGQRELLLNFMHRYYQSMATLTPQICHDLFEQTWQADVHMMVWIASAEIRAAAKADLTLLSYDFTLDCLQVETNQDGLVSVRVSETTAMRFAVSPDVQSELLGITHRFVLSGSEQQGWKIRSHIPWDSAYYPFFQAMHPQRRENHELAEQQETELPNWLLRGQLYLTVQDYLAPELQEMLCFQLENAARNMASRDSTADGGTRQLSADHPYDRQAALCYALQWAGERNPDWSAYDIYGGNCMNYVSQCLYAGGIPMDRSGASWYWYSDTRRTSSWSGVNPFLIYAGQNTGYGLVCDTEADYYSGEIGDIILMGVDNYRHAVIISKVLTDPWGNVMDYLICSNTGNYRDFPAGAYYYTNQKLLHIVGFND